MLDMVEHYSAVLLGLVASAVAEHFPDEVVGGEDLGVAAPPWAQAKGIHYHCVTSSHRLEGLVSE